ncbi:MAG: SAM-dependent DNA methyltransferase [Planctomycetaceae bacterium]|nr:SAM-dependent DNA methyltransferase [Planctomycetaceae bacterium]
MNHQVLFNFIWQIADLLRGLNRPPQYERVMLPFVVLRRFDCVLAKTKAKVVAEYDKLKGGKITGDALDPRLNKVAGPKFRFHNHSPLDLEKLKGDPDHIDKHLVSYINGFSANVRRIFEYFEIAAEIEKMHEANVLFLVVSKFCEVDLHPEKVTNEDMGRLFEHLIRKFNEQANETAGDHFTPREVIHLMVDLLFIDDDDILSKANVVRKLLDPACGTGGMLSEALNYIDEHEQSAELWVFGQDYNKRSYAVAASDLLLKGRDNSEIAFGDSLVDDQFGPNHSATQGRFDYLLANPPFGVDWKKQQKAIADEHKKLGFAGRFGAGLPRVNDGALLFLQHMISKFEPPEKGGSRLAIVFNGSPLFTGGAGSGESEIRKWIIENDWLEAIVALPEQMFFNTGIGTYIWVVTNRKEKHRRGKIQLVDAREFYIPMLPRPLGDKRRKIGEGPTQDEPPQIQEIVKAYGTADEVEAAFLKNGRGVGLKWITLTNGGRKPTPAEDQTVEVRCISKMFDNDDFGFRRVTVERPLRLCFQITPERKSRFLDALPKLLDDVQAIDKQIGREPCLDWNSVLKQVEGVLESEGSKWKKPQFKLFRDVFTDADPEAVPVVSASRAVKRDSAGPLYGWFPDAQKKQECRYEADSKLRDFENIPLKEDETEYFTREVLPHVPDAWIDAEKTKIGYEINFNRHFYVYTPPRPLTAIDLDLKKAEDEILRLLKEVTE